MSRTNPSKHIPSSQFIIYKTEDGQTKLDVRFDGDTVWLTQAAMAELFQTTKQNISLHIQNVISEKELQGELVVKEFLTTAVDGKNYQVKYYNLDMIISVGYRIKSKIATTFRQWATKHLTEFIVKGFVLDDERLKNPDLPFDYFEELTRRIQDIRLRRKDFIRRSPTFMHSVSITIPKMQLVSHSSKQSKINCTGQSQARQQLRLFIIEQIALNRIWD